MNLYTKEGKPLQVGGDIVYSRSGVPVGRIRDDRVLGTDGKYVGTIVGDRLVYRSTHDTIVGAAFTVADRASSGKANRGASGLWGDEPRIPD